MSHDDCIGHLFAIAAITGAVVRTVDQLEGLEPIHEDWGLTLGEELDTGKSDFVVPFPEKSPRLSYGFVMAWMFVCRWRPPSCVGP